jgi:hypothetical protein
MTAPGVGQPRWWPWADRHEVFATDEGRYEAWLAHRDDLMADPRAGAWWTTRRPKMRPIARTTAAYDPLANTISQTRKAGITITEYELDRLRSAVSHGLLADTRLPRCSAARRARPHTYASAPRAPRTPYSTA